MAPQAWTQLTLQAIVSNAFNASSGSHFATDTETMAQFQASTNQFYSDLCRKAYSTPAQLAAQNFDYVESPFPNGDGSNVLYEYVSTGVDHVQLYLPITQQNSPIVFSITGTDTLFNSIKPIGLLLDYVGLPSFGGFSAYITEYTTIRNVVLSLLAGVIGQSPHLNTREVVFCGHSMGAYTAFKIYDDLYHGLTYQARLGGVKAFCPFVWSDNLTTTMQRLCQSATTRSEIEIFAIKSDYSSALLKTANHAFGTIKWYDGDGGGLDYTDVDAFSVITQAAYLSNANHTIDNFSPSDPVTVISSLPKVDYGQNKSINTLKEGVLEEAGFGQTQISLLMYSDDVDTAGIKFDLPNASTTDTQFSFTVNYESTYRNKYFYYNLNGTRYVSLLTELASHSNSVYKPSLYFTRHSTSPSGNQNYLMYDYDGTNKNYVKLKQGQFSTLLLPDPRVGGQVYSFEYTDRQTTAIGESDVAAATGDSLERFLFHVTPAIDASHSQRRTVTSYTEPYNLYNIVPSAGTQDKYMIYHTTNNSNGDITNFYMTLGQHGSNYGIDIHTIQNAVDTNKWWSSPTPIWDEDIKFPADEALWLMKSRYDVNQEPYIVEINSTYATQYGRDINPTIASASLTNTSAPFNQPTPASATYHQLTDFTYMSNNHFKAKMRVMNLPITASDAGYFRWFEAGSSDATNGYYGNFQADGTQAQGCEFVFVKTTATLDI